jgi:hypothetical protein
MKLARGLLVALLLVAASCGPPDPELDRRSSAEASRSERSSSGSLPRFAGKPEKMSEALRQVTALVDATSRAVGSGMDVTPAGDNGSTKECETDRDLVYTSYGVEINLQDDGSKLFDSTVAYWRDNGYEVVVRDASSNAPSAYLNFGDFSFQMYVNSLTGSAFIGGSTPCYAPSG